MLRSFYAEILKKRRWWFLVSIVNRFEDHNKRLSGDVPVTAVVLQAWKSHDARPLIA